MAEVTVNMDTAACGAEATRCNYEVADEQSILADDDWVILESMEGGRYRVEVESVERSATVKSLMEDVGTGNVIPVPNVGTAALGKVTEFLSHYNGRPLPGQGDEDDEKSEKPNFAGSRKKPAMDEWDEKFVEVDNDLIFLLIESANYLDVKQMLAMCCWKVASKIKGRTPEEIRAEFNIENDFTEEEMEQIKRENEWVTE